MVVYEAGVEGWCEDLELFYWDGGGGSLGGGWELVVCPSCVEGPLSGLGVY